MKLFLWDGKKCPVEVQGENTYLRTLLNLSLKKGFFFLLSREKKHEFDKDILKIQFMKMIALDTYYIPLYRSYLQYHVQSWSYAQW